MTECEEDKMVIQELKQRFRQMTGEWGYTIREDMPTAEYVFKVHKEDER